jgi:hypothetical protein
LLYSCNKVDSEQINIPTVKIEKKF